MCTSRSLLIQLLAIVAAALPYSHQAIAITYNNQTLSGTVLLPAGQTHEFRNTITLSNATVELEGTLRNVPATVVVQGDGAVNIRGPAGSWTDFLNSPHLTLGPGVNVQGFYGARFEADGVNQGTIAAVAGGNGGAAGNKFSVQLDKFKNEGLIEARSEALLDLFLMDGLFENDGTIRVDAGGTAKIGVEVGSPLTAEALGVIENNGVVKLDQFRMAGSGEFQLRGAGVWEFDRYTEIVGSTLTIPMTATARIVPTSNTRPKFRGVTLNGVMQSAEQSTAVIQEGLTLNGEWRTRQGASIDFVGTQTISGGGKFIAEERSSFRSNGVTTFESGVDLIVPNGGELLLWEAQGATGPTYMLRGDVLIEGGSLTMDAREAENHGLLHASSGGSLTFGDYSWQTFVNHGSLRIDSGATLRISSSFVNHGTTTVENANVWFELPTQGNALSIVDSTIYAGMMNQTLTQLQAIPRTRSEIVAAAPVDLEGQALTIADEDNRRWAAGAGGYQNGTIDSADGYALLSVGRGGVLRDLVLNADARVVTGGQLQVNSSVTGTGKFIVDGGTLQLGAFGGVGGAIPSEMLARVVPQPNAVGSAVVIGGPMENAGRTIHLRDGATWLLKIGRSKGIIGGRIEGNDAVELAIAGYGPYSNAGDLSGVTLAARARVVGVAAVESGLTLDGGVLSIGGDHVQSTRNYVTFLGDSVLDGVGEVHFDGAAPTSTNPYPRALSTQGPTARLTIAAGITVRTSGGGGAIGNFYLANGPSPANLTNEGMLLAENGHTLTLVTNDFVQRGTLRAAEASTLAVIDGTFLNEGSLEAAGGQMTFSGDFAQTSGAAIKLELRDPGIAPTAAPIEVAGLATLGGVLQLTLAAGYVPAVGDVFQLLAATGGVAGAFEQLTLPALTPGLFWELEVTPHAVAASIADGAPAGDFDFNGRVDGADFLAWQRGQSPTPLSASDLDDWRANFGSDASGATTLAVPEPAGLLLFALGCATMLSRRGTSSCPGGPGARTRIITH